MQRASDFSLEPLIGQHNRGRALRASTAREVLVFCPTMRNRFYVYDQNLAPFLGQHECLDPSAVFGLQEALQWIPNVLVVIQIMSYVLEKGLAF
jgi:hypothetical protein